MVRRQKVGAIIQARYDSTRLPGKVLMKLPFGGSISILGHIVKRLQQVNFVDEIIIATSNEKNDDPIVDEANKLGVKVYRGSKENVLERFYFAAGKYKLDCILRFTGDNPVVLTDLLFRGIEEHIEKKYDYTRNSGLPYGTSFEIVNPEVLKKILETNPTKQECEHVTLHIYNNKEKFNINEVEHAFSIDTTLIRLTVDYPSDYALVNLLMIELKKKKFIYTINDILNFFVRNPSFHLINSGNFQKKQFANSTEEIIEAIDVMRTLSMTVSQNILERHLTKGG